MIENQAASVLMSRRRTERREVREKLFDSFLVAHPHLGATDRKMRNEIPILRVEIGDAAGKRGREFPNPLRAAQPDP